MKLHFGPPEHTACLRFFRGTIRAKGYPDTDCYFEHPIRSWFGISLSRVFIGIIRTDETRNARQTGRAALNQKGEE